MGWARETWRIGRGDDAVSVAVEDEEVRSLVGGAARDTVRVARARLTRDQAGTVPLLRGAAGVDVVEVVWLTEDGTPESGPDLYFSPGVRWNATGG